MHVCMNGSMQKPFKHYNYNYKYFNYLKYARTAKYQKVYKHIGFTVYI